MSMSQDEQTALTNIWADVNYAANALKRAKFGLEQWAKRYQADRGTPHSDARQLVAEQARHECETAETLTHQVRNSIAAIRFTD